MHVRVRLFAILRERAGIGELELDLPERARVRDALELLGTITTGVPVVMAVNREYADEDAYLGAGDELALIPCSTLFATPAPAPSSPFSA